MWCWGCDVRASTGNLLVAYGFERRPSTDPRDNSAYTYATSPTSSLTVWGFGLVYACESLGSMLLHRQRFDPRYADAVYLALQAWTPKQLPPFRRPADAGERERLQRLLVAALGCIAAYERWLGEQTTADYRSSAVQSWPQRRRLKGVPAGEMADAWNALATHAEFASLSQATRN